jgi:hypothetical protein
VELFNPVWRLLLDFAILFATVWLIRAIATLAGQRLGRQTASWPVVQGTIEQAGPKMIGEGHTAYWVGELSYSDSVSGEYYAGVAHLPASNEDAACEVTQRLKDRKQLVRVMPGNPERSVLVLNEQFQPVIAPDLNISTNK